MNQLTQNIYTQDSENAANQAVLQNMNLDYLDSDEGSGGSITTLYEERKKANKVYAIQFIPGNGRDFPEGEISFHIICDNAVDNKIVNSSVKIGSVLNKKVIQAPKKVYVTDANDGSLDEVDADSIQGILIIDVMPDTIEIGGENRFVVNSFTLKTGSASEIDSHLVKIKLYPH